jgi:hypothetical protein
MKKNCKNCNQEYITYEKISSYCSNKCKHKYQVRKQHPKYIKEKPIGSCKYCGLGFFVTKKRIKYCSVNCYKSFIKKPERKFALDGYIKQEKKTFLLPSEVLDLVYNLGLKEDYIKTNFKKYSVKEYGERKLMNICKFDTEFRERLTRKTNYAYARVDGLDRWINSLKKSRYVFYDENEVMEWIYINKN